MEIDLELLDYLCHKGVHHIEAALRGHQHLPRTVVGVGTFLLDHDGNIDLLTAKQRVTFDTFLTPLLFAVPCLGPTGTGDCRGNGHVEPELLLKGYRDNELLCGRCRNR